MRTVGEFYDRLNAFLSALEDQAQAQAQSNAEKAEESNQGETQ
jgi:DNA replication initiation complex subunit (GINS family)